MKTLVRRPLLYGYGRVLKDEQPSLQRQNEIWKDGIGILVVFSNEGIHGLNHERGNRNLYGYI